MPLYVKDGKAVFYVHVPKTGGTGVERFFAPTTTATNISMPAARRVSTASANARPRPPPPITRWFDQMIKQFQENGFVRENHIRPQSEFCFPGCEIFRQDDGYGKPLFARIEDTPHAAATT